MSSEEYHRRLADHQLRTLRRVSGDESISSRPNSEGDDINIDNPTEDIKSLLCSLEENEIKHRFKVDDDRPHRTGGSVADNDHSLKFTCRTYFSSQFAALRKAYIGNESLYLESLSRCNAMDTTGGKSGASFSRTWDKRFIAKHVTSRELDMFLANATKYFSYMSAALFDNLPTILVKILGVYQVVIPDSAGRRVTKQLVIMEDLFHGREIHHKFDLKGILRKAAHHEGEEDAVLLDDNLMEFTKGFPLPLLVSYFRLSTRMRACMQITFFVFIISGTLSNSFEECYDSGFPRTCQYERGGLQFIGGNR